MQIVKLVPILLSLMFIVNCSKNESSDPVKPDVAISSEEQAKIKLITQAYIFGYPLMTMDYTHKVSSNVETANEAAKAPINQWGDMHLFPKAGFTDVVRPNVDTYYSVIFADLSKNPLYLHIPATKRYYLIPILNAYGDVISSLGSRTTGQEALDIAFVGPDYTGEIDSDLTVIRSTTSLNWVLGRVAVKNDTDGKDEIANFQSKLIARPLSERNNADYASPKGTVNPKYLGAVPMDIVDNMAITPYLNEVMQLMVANPAYPADKPLLDQLKTIGFEAGGTFNINSFSPQAQAQIKQVPANVQSMFAKMTKTPSEELLQNGWMVITSGLGEYGTEYFLRAYVTKIGYGANQAVDAIYPNSAVDSDGNNYNASNKYVMHFDAGELPEVKGFWSLTMYDKKGFLVDNAIDRYNLGSLKDLTFNSDGSLDIYIQAEAPVGKESNWLPSPPAGQEFELTFRMYYPGEEVLNRTYIMPSVQKVTE